MNDKTSRLIVASTVVALLLALGGYALISWRAEQAVTADELSALERQGDLNTQQMQQRLTDTLAGKVGSEAQERLDSPLGQALFRKCVEWTDFHDNHPNELSLEHRNAACSEFRRYVDEGTRPDQRTNRS
ncbi:MAG TPA: hypothetical protein PKK10_04035 [Woeseiaceae bacterium]|nr:hypothetical protein [Woeseiaceae bacterium]